MSTIDENDSIATELGPSEDSATPMLTGELAAGGGAATVVSVPVPELVSSERFSSTGELAAGGGAATVVSVPFFLGSLYKLHPLTDVRML